MLIGLLADPVLKVLGRRAVAQRRVAATSVVEDFDGAEKTWAAQTCHETLVIFWSEGGIMEWTIKLEAKTGRGEVTEL